MEKTRLSVNILEKTLTIDGTPMTLEDEFRNAHIDNPSTPDQALVLEYPGKFTEDIAADFPSPVIRETDKLTAIYSKGLLERVNVSPSMEINKHSLTFYGNINPVIEGPTRQCYDILEPLESRNKRTIP